MSHVEIRTVPEIRLAAREHVGPYAEIRELFDELSSSFSAHNFWPHARCIAAVYFDDPTSVPETDLHSAAGVVVDDEFDMPEDFKEMTIGGARCAAIRHVGPYSGLPEAWRMLYHDWLPGAGETPAGAPFELFLNKPSDTAPEDLVTEICLPLR